MISGSILEALLLNEIINYANQTEVDALKPELGRDSNKEPEDWFLGSYITVAGKLEIIEEDSQKSAELTKDFRNLIHPGRAIRLQKECNRGDCSFSSRGSGVSHSGFKPLNLLRSPNPPLTSRLPTRKGATAYIP